MSFVVRTPNTEAEFAALAELEGWAFGTTADDAAKWLSAAGHDNTRIVTDSAGIPGGLLHIPMAQFFGGRSVPMVGIAGVAVAPEARGRGVALAMMQDTVRELQSRGVALSTLYPATLTLYRKVGWELAGHHFEVSVKLREIGIRDKEGTLRRITDADASAIESTYREVARQSPGHTDRGPYIWQRVRTPRGEPARGTLVEFDGKVEGYVYMLSKRVGGFQYDLRLLDLVATTPRAARRLLGFLSDHRSVGETAVWFGGASTPIITQMPERTYSIKLVEHWMLRLCDVEAALAARGYPAGVELSVELDVADPLIPANNGRFVLEVADGVGRVRRGGSGAVSVDIRGLGALYSGFASPQNLQRQGLLNAETKAAARAATVFSGAAPELVDFF